MSGAKPTMVGRFFEEVIHCILGGKLTRDEDGDVCLQKEGVTVEVKSSGEKSSYGFRLDTEQIESNSRKIPFPFDHSWYVLIAYRNRTLPGGNGSRSTELAKHNSEASVRRYLSQAILWAVVIDITLVERWSETRPVSRKSILGHLGTKTVDIKCQEVWKLVENTATELEKLGFPPDQFKKICGTTEDVLTKKFKTGFPLVALLPASQVPMAKAIFRNRGIRLRRNKPQ